jgi:putative transposase
MPRSARILLPGHIYHLTHRCHNGSYFLRFNIVRANYRRRLWQCVLQFGIQMLNYCITSNHTHLLLIAAQPNRISVMMRHLEGEFASYFNRREGRSGTFWNERYHSTLIEDGSHLWNCMNYIDLNMVRAGVVDHPGDWRWCGYQEIMGLRQRYRILDLEELVRLGGATDQSGFARWYDTGLTIRIKSGSLQREPIWTESIAVGSKGFVSRIATLARERKNLEINNLGENCWFVREPNEHYACIQDYGKHPLGGPIQY